jgi:zinc transport system substrate-binding protein
MFNYVRCITCMVCFFSLSTAYAEPKIMASIKPIHGLVSAVMEGVASPEQLLPDNSSPHTFQLKPSDIKKIQQAEIIFWVGPELETFLQKTLSNFPQKSHALIQAPELTLLNSRSGAQWHHHHDHHHEHSLDKNNIDPHIWLSPENALVMLDVITKKLSEVDAENKLIYQKNSYKTKQKILAAKQKIYVQLQDFHEVPYLVFHDAYQYFETSFQIPAFGSIAVNPEVPLSGHALHKVRKQIKEEHISCVFTEPEFKSYPINNALKDLKVNINELDPLGVYVDSGKDHYTNLLFEIGNSMFKCFGSSGKT